MLFYVMRCIFFYILFLVLCFFLKKGRTQYPCIDVTGFVFFFGGDVDVGCII